MGLLNQILAQAATQNPQAGSGPGLAKPLTLALGALLVGKMMHEGASTASQPTATAATNGGIPDGGLMGGLSGLLQKLNDAGHADAVKSWTSPAANQPISTGHLSAAIGPQNVTAAAQQSGLNEPELLQHLAQNLPQIVSSLTNNGTSMPTLAQVAAALTQGQK